MKSKLLRTLAAALSVGALVTALVAAHPATTSAANLTGGNYTYVINGEEVTFMFDPVVRKEGLLLPTEVFTEFGIKVDGTATREVTLTKDDLGVKVTVGSNRIDLGGTAKNVVTSPLRLNGRVFLPADLLKEFGVDFVQDGTMLFMTPLVKEMPKVQTLLSSQWDAFKGTRGFSNNIKSDAGVFMMGDVMLLDSYMVNTTNIGVTYGMRARLNSMLETNTLILVRLSNLTSRSGGMQTAGAYLVDDQRNQYDLIQVLDIGQGLLTAKLAPGADRMGVLVYPKLNDSIKSFSMFYDANIATLGTFPVTK